MDIISKIGELKTSSTERLKDYFTNLNYSETEQFSRCCDLVYFNEDFGTDPNITKFTKDIDMNFFSWYQNGILLTDIKQSIKEITEKFEVKYLWVMAYPPKDRLPFHFDGYANRHSLTFNYNEKFYNYEFNLEMTPGDSTPVAPEHSLGEFNDKFNSAGETLDSFNNFFINYHENCKITAMESQSIYTFGNTIHSFANDTDDKVRFNFIFEIRE